MGPDELRAMIAAAVADAVQAKALPPESAALAGLAGLAGTSISLRPVDGRVTGVVADWVTPVAIRWAPALGLPPRALAGEVAARLSRQDAVAAVEAAPDGLLAVTLCDAARAQVVRAVLDQPDTYAAPHGYVPVPEEPPGFRPAGDPLRSVQFSHARLCRLVRTATAGGVRSRGPGAVEDLTEPSERLLLVALADQPQRLARHRGHEAQLRLALIELAQRADAWRSPPRPLRRGEPVLPLHGSRLALAAATRIVLRNGLAGLGASAPERM